MSADVSHSAAFSREIEELTYLDIIRAETVNEAVHILDARDDIECIVSDYDVPDIDGLAFLQSVRAQYIEIPFILFTSEGNEKVASKAITAHVTDYLIKEQLHDQWEELAALIENAISYHQSHLPLADSSSRLRVILNSVPDSIAIIQNDTFCYANDSALDIFGADSLETMAEREPTDYIAAEIQEATKASLDAIESGDAVVDRLDVTIVGHQRTRTAVELTAVSIKWTGSQAILLILRDLSEQKQRQQDLEQARDLMAHMEQLAEAGAWEYDSATERLMITDGARRLYGLDPDEGLTPEAALAAIHPDDRDLLADRINNCLETGESYEIEVRLTPHDGAQRWLAAQGERVSESEPGSSVRGYIRDITEQKAHERDLKRYRTVFNELPDPVVVYDVNGQYDLINDAATEIRDLPREELRGTKSPYFEQIQAANPTAFEALLEASRDTLRVELIEEFPGRGKRTLQCDLTRVSTETESAGIVIVTRDITERKEREDQLRRRTKAIEEAPVGVSITDPDQEDNPLIYVNDAFVELTGYSRDEVLGQNCRLLQGEETDIDRVARLREAIDAEDPVSIALRNYRNDGTEFWNQLAIAPVRNDTGDVVNYIGFQQDVTERKRRQEQLEIIDRILRHNLRNDMNVIQGRAEIIHSQMSGEVADYAGKILDKSDQLMELAEKEQEITGLLRDEPVQEEISVGERLQTVASTIGSEYPDATITVDCPAGVTVHATNRFEELISELVRNGIIHNDSPSPEVEVSVTQSDETARIEIADTGPPIPEIERAILFDDEERTPLLHGTGLGLWFVKLVTARSGGTLTVEENSPAGNIVGIELSC